MTNAGAQVEVPANELQKAYLATAFTVLVWSSAFTGIAYALRSFTPERLVLFRFLAASASLALYALARGLKRADVRDLPRMAALGFVGITVYHVCLAFGQRHVPAGTASLIVATVPIWTALFGRLLGNERLNRLGWTAIFVSFLGVALIVLSRANDLSFSVAAGLVIISAISTSLMYVLQAPLVRKYGSIDWTIYCIWFGTLPLLVFLPGLGAEIAAAPSSAILAVLYIGTLPVYCYITWSYALIRLSPTFTTSFLNIGPIFSVLIAWFVLDELPSWLAVVGGGIAIGGVFLLNLKARRARPKSI